MTGRVGEVLGLLGFTADVARVERLGHGLIHRTYLVEAEARTVVLQQINRLVFPEPDLLADNTRRVVEGLNAAAARGDYPMEIARPLGPPIRVGDEIWRASTHIGNSYAIDRVDDLARAARGAAAFGQFCAALAPLDPAEIAELLPGFHDLHARRTQLEEAVREDGVGRVAAVAAEIEACLTEDALGRDLRDLQAELPRRVCHNDTKINNLLFDSDDHRPRAVVDLDTCMPGWWMHDFGDIVRTFCATDDENSSDPDGVAVRDDYLRTVWEGFTAPLAGHLSPRERESLWYGARAMPLMLAMRFLADHLRGDVYFRVESPGQNLERARNQIALYRDLTNRESALRKQLA